MVGVAWWLWHLPLVCLTGRFLVDELPEYCALGGLVVATSTFMGWMMERVAGRLLPALLYHTAMNWGTWIVVPSLQFTVLPIVVMCGFVRSHAELSHRGAGLQTPRTAGGVVASSGSRVGVLLFSMVC